MRRQFAKAKSVLYPPLGLEPKRGGLAHAAHGEGDALMVTGTPKGLSTVKTSYPSSSRKTGSGNQFPISPGATPKKSTEFTKCCHCSQWGHGYKQCKSRPAGWRPSNEVWEATMDAVARARNSVQSRRGGASPKGRDGGRSPSGGRSPRGQRSPRAVGFAIETARSPKSPKTDEWGRTLSSQREDEC